MDESAPSPVAELLALVQNALHSRRAKGAERVVRMDALLESYRRALEAEIAREFAREHGFKLPQTAALSARRAAELLRDAVLALPELVETPRLDASTTNGAEAPNPALASARELPSDASLPASGYARLSERARDRKIVVIGALSGRDRSSVLPAALAEQTEWVDTERDGAHAIGNLPQRVRQGRVAAVIILDRAVQHKHTEPVMAAARESDVPVVFAGQGGKGSLVRALDQLEKALSAR